MALSLFSTETQDNMLPCDGYLHYYGPIFSSSDANQHLKQLQEEIVWKQDEVMMFGKLLMTKRKVAWYGDAEYPYTYSRVTRKALPWTAHLLSLKQRVEEVTKCTYNSCLLNLYHNGMEGMGWHSDAEQELLPQGAIASLSFGAERRFILKHKQNPKRVEQLLEHGSLLLMAGTTQQHWLHSIPIMRKVVAPRINLTFRTIGK